MKKVKSLSEVLKKLYNKIESNAKLAFVITTIAMFICHIVYFINRWANEDDFHSILGELNMIGSGRFMPGTVLSSWFLAPVVLLIISMIALGLISMMIINMFKIKNKIYVIITSLLLATFPILALGFGYGFMVERYVMGMFFAVFTVFIANKFKYSGIISAFTLAITMGYYQSYIAISIGLIMFMIIFKMFENKKIKENLKYIVKFLLIGICGVIIYMVAVRVVCHFTNTPLLDYKGINNMGSLPPLNKMGFLLKRTYLDFINFYLSKNFLRPMWYGRIAQFILCISTIILISIMIKKNKIYKHKLNLILLIIIILLIPMGFNIIDFMAYESETSSLNIYQFVLILILPFLLLDKIDLLNINRNFFNTIEWVGVISAIVLIWNNFIITNVYYLKINDFYTTTVQLTNRVYNRIEQMPNYDGTSRIMVGNKKGIYMDSRVYKDYYKYILYDQGLWDQFIGYAPRPEGTDFKFHYLVENILGVHLNSVTSKEFEKIYNSEEYKGMESWPKQNCIKYIGDVIVVKIS